MSAIAIQIDRVSKKFCRTLSGSLRYGLQDAVGRIFRRPRAATLRRDEFWALDDVSATVAAGECLGLIGPNGAGKSTLLRLVNQDLRPERGNIVTTGRVKDLIRLGSGLQPLLTGRENIQIKCAELGLSARETAALLDDIVAFTELDQALDRPVKQYSDGMYARLEFGIATCVPISILLIDEVLAVGDIAFQLRSLDRLNELKQQGTAMLFVSHSETNIRLVADRCLLLFDGKPLALGSPPALLYKYHEAVGYLNRQLRPLGVMPDMPADFETGTVPISLRNADGDGSGTLMATPGARLEWILDYRRSQPRTSLVLMLQFWNPADILVASLESPLPERPTNRAITADRIRIRIPYLPLAAGRYRIAGAFAVDGGFISYRRQLAILHVAQTGYLRYGGLTVINAELSNVDLAP